MSIYYQPWLFKFNPESVFKLPFRHTLFSPMIEQLIPVGCMVISAGLPYSINELVLVTK